MLDQGNSFFEAEAPEKGAELFQQLHHVSSAQLLPVLLPNLPEEYLPKLLGEVPTPNKLKYLLDLENHASKFEAFGRSPLFVLNQPALELFFLLLPHLHKRLG